MALVEINWQPADRQLRQFGFIALVALPGLAWLWGGSTQLIGILGTVGLLCAVLGLLAPRALKPVFVTLTVLVMPIGMIIGELAMLLIYFGLFLPIALIFRLTKRDALQLKLQPNEPSYWRAKKKPRSAASYYRQS